jgi:hypothetical protein
MSGGKGERSREKDGSHCDNLSDGPMTNSDGVGLRWRLQMGDADAAATCDDGRRRMVEVEADVVWWCCVCLWLVLCATE